MMKLMLSRGTLGIVITMETLYMEKLGGGGGLGYALKKN